MQFVSTVSSFLHIMIRHTVDFCKNEPRFIPLIIFHLNYIFYYWWWKWIRNIFLFHSWKIRAEDGSPLTRTEEAYFSKLPVIYAPCSSSFKNYCPMGIRLWIAFHINIINVPPYAMTRRAEHRPKFWNPQTANALCRLWLIFGEEDFQRLIIYIYYFSIIFQV